MRKIKRSVAGAIAGLMCAVSAPAVPMAVYNTTAYAASVGQTLSVGNGQNQHKEDNVDGYSYEIWLDNTGGSGSMTLGSGGAFNTQWSAQVSQGNFLARRGRNYDASKKATQYGTIVMDYAAEYSASSQGNSRLCVYGWFKDPLVEYYIIEDWVNWRPSANGGAQTVTVDGAEYEIFQLDHTGPTILGDTRTFKQYFSVRKNKRTSGTITVSDHFAAWEKAGWNIGNLTEVALNVEGWESSGKANVSKLTIGNTKTDGGGNTGGNTGGNNGGNTGGNNGGNDGGNQNPWGGGWPWGGGNDNPWGGGNNNGGNNDGGNTSVSTGDGLKNIFEPWFKIGTSVSPHELSSGASFLKQNYSSITPENELKPDSILDQSACQQKGNNVNTQINLSRAAQTLKFCEDNGISLRGHTFVWYSQTPDWFFRENFSNNGAYVSKDIMNQRLESMIKNTFAALKEQYPKLDVYSYDVCNELFVNDGGGMRPANNSNWVKVYGDDSFVINAFKYARQYAPAGCKLYLNDYNEYMPAKTQDLCNMAKKIMQAGDYIDGIGMQSHLDTSYPSAQVYETALKAFIDLGLDVQITELDITCSDFTAQANLYEAIFKIAMENAEHIPALTIWGTQDNVSWRSSQNPLLFSQGYKPKAAYDKVVALAKTMTPPAGENTTTKAPETTATTTTTKATTQAPETTASKVSKWGDANVDGTVSMADAVMIMQSLANPSKYQMTAEGSANGDVNLAGNGITNADALAIQKFMVGLIKELPESYSETQTTTKATTTTTTTKATTTTTTTKAPTTTKTVTQASGQTFNVKNGSNRFAEDDVNGYSYEIWLDQTGGSGSMTLGDGGTFSTEWSAQVSQGNFLARRGRNYDRTKKATDVGTIVMDYEADYSASSQGNSRLCVYGWTVDPLVEYYIIEDWVNWRPQAQGGSKTVTIDGAEYEIFQLDHTGPTILGDTRTFKQYFSVRKQKRTSGTITVSDHFKAWADAGWNIGNLTEVALNVEGWESSGKANVTKLEISAGGGGGNNTTTTANGGSTAVTTTASVAGKLDPSKPMIAVSFDDGAVGSSPTASSMRIINALADNGFNATFFYVGSWTQNKGNDGAQEIKYAYQKGMEIANHTWTHPQNLPSMGTSGIQDEINKTANLLKSITGAEPAKLLRLPYLNNGPALSQALPDYGLVTCAIDTKDWDNASADSIYNTIKQAIDSGQGNGAVVLCHETYDTTAAAIERIAPYAKQKGWQIAAIGDMYAAKGKSIPGGQTITKVY